MQNCHNAWIQIKSKLWIEVGKEAVFGRGRVKLLEAIDKYGSINQAAKEVNISYRKALEYIKAMEQRLQMDLVYRKTGGKNGGGAMITNEAREFIAKYKELDKDVEEYVDNKFQLVFNEFLKGRSQKG